MWLILVHFLINKWEMSEQIGHLYVRAESEEEVHSGSGSNGSPKKSTSLSSLRNLRDTFKRSESRASQTSLAASTLRNENNESGSTKKPGEYSTVQISLCIFSSLMGLR